MSKKLIIFLIFAGLTFFSGEAWVSRVYNKTVTISELADQASAIFKVEKVSDAEDVTVLNETGAEFKLKFYSYKIVEILKAGAWGSFDNGMSFKSPPRSGFKLSEKALREKAPHVGQLIFIADRSPLQGGPPQGKSYYEYHIEAPAEPGAKQALFFTAGFTKNLSVYFGVFGLGLVDASREPMLKSATDIRLFFDAVRSRNLENLKSAIAKQPSAINQVDPTWGTPLQFAARYGSKDEIALLIANGASLSTPDAKGNGVLHNLVESQFVDNLPYVIKLSGNINGKNAAGLTALHLAVKGNARTNMLKMLIDAGADPNVKDSSGQSALELAKTLANPEVLSALSKFESKP